MRRRIEALERAVKPPEENEMLRELTELGLGITELAALSQFFETAEGTLDLPAVLAYRQLSDRVKAVVDKYVGFDHALASVPQEYRESLEAQAEEIDPGGREGLDYYFRYGEVATPEHFAHWAEADARAAARNKPTEAVRLERETRWREEVLERRRKSGMYPRDTLPNGDKQR